MLVELRARDLGVIADLRILFGEGMTAITGETGAGKTLVVEALGLLLGGRADPAMVRGGREEAWVEGRFVDQDGAEVVLARVVPASGRPRAYVDGRMAPAAALAERGLALVDLHGQHAHQSLLKAEHDYAVQPVVHKYNTIHRPLDHPHSSEEVLVPVGSEQIKVPSFPSSVPFRAFCVVRDGVLFRHYVCGYIDVLGRRVLHRR